MRTRKVWRSFLKTTNFTCPLVTKSLYDNCHYELMELITRSGKHEPIDHSPAINCCEEVDEIIRTRGVCWWWFDFLRWNRTLKRQHFLILFSELVLVSLASIVSQRMMKKHVRVLIDLSLSSVFHDPWQIQFVPSSPFQSSKQIHSWRIIPIPPECSYVFQLQLCTTYPQQWDPIRFLSRYKKCNVFLLKHAIFLLRVLNGWQGLSFSQLIRKDERVLLEWRGRRDPLTSECKTPFRRLILLAWGRVFPWGKRRRCNCLLVLLRPKWDSWSDWIIKSVKGCGTFPGRGQRVRLPGIRYTNSSPH